MYNRDSVLHTLLEEDLLPLDLLDMNLDKQWLHLLINGSISPNKTELLKLLEEIARLTNTSIHRLKLKYNYWLYQ